MADNLQKGINDLNFSINIQSFPILRGLRIIKDFYIDSEEQFNISVKQLNERNERNQQSDGEGFKSLNIAHLKVVNDISQVKSSIHTLRSSTLLMLCAFIEHVFMKCILDDKVLNDKYKALKGENGSTLMKAKQVLMNKYDGLDSIDLDYMNNIHSIRNKFVHSYGLIYSQALPKKWRKYDIALTDNKIILGDDFIPNYIEFLENCSVQVAEILYDDENKITKLMNEIGLSNTLKNLNDTLFDLHKQGV